MQTNSRASPPYRSQPAPAQPASSNDFHWTLAMKLSEIMAEINALSAAIHDRHIETHHRLRELPEQTAMAVHSRQRPAPSRQQEAKPMGTLRQLTGLLTAGQPYVPLLRRLSILILVWPLVVAGNYDPNTIAEILASAIKRYLTG